MVEEKWCDEVKFVVNYKCENCRNRFKKGYKKGVEINQETDIEMDTYVKKFYKNKLLHFGEKETCPHCGSNNIRITNRRKIE